MITEVGVYHVLSRYVTLVVWKSYQSADELRAGCRRMISKGRKAGEWERLL